MKDVIDKTLNDSSTMWSGVAGTFGALTISEWCLLITVVITIFNFIKMLEEEHQLKVGHKNDTE